MKRWMGLSAMGLAGVAVMAFGRQMPPAPQVNQIGNEAPPAVHAAIERTYGPSKAKTEIFAKSQVNGITVYDVHVTTPEGESVSRITQDGNYVEQGFPMAVDTAPPGVQHIAHNLLRSAAGVSRVDHVVYFVNLQAGEGQYEFQMDATGTIQEMRPLGQRFFETAEQLPEADAPNKAVITSKTEAIVPGAHVTDVRIAYALTHFYFARFDVAGGHGWAEVNPNGQTIQVIRPDDVSKLPGPVMNTVNRFFKSDKILDVHSGVMRYFDVEEQSGNDDLVLHVRADGIVQSVSNYSK